MRARLLPLMLLAVLLQAGAEPAAPQLTRPGFGAVQIAFITPAPGQVVFGAVDVRVAVSPPQAQLTKVEIYLDGQRVAVVEKPPYRTVVDVGQKNAEHRFEAVAYDASGAVASTLLRTPVIQTDEVVQVDLRQLYITVEEGGKPGGYTRQDFTVMDQGVRQQVVTFERGDVPFTAVMLLDSSASMQGGRLDTALDGARSFFNAMHRLDEGKLLLFSDRLLKETPFTSVPAILNLGLTGATAEGGTALNDAFYVALKRLEPRQGRKVVVLLSDGGDIESALPMARVREVAQRSQAVFFWLRLRREEERLGTVRRYSTWRDADAHQEELDALRDTILESGGRIEPIDAVSQIGDALANVLRELREQYVVGYYPSRSVGAGTWHEIDVRTSDGARLRLHRGYAER